METQDNAPLKLQDEVAKHYEVAPGKVRVFYSGKLGRTVDLNKVTLDGVKTYVDAGYLVKKGISASKAKE